MEWYRRYLSPFWPGSMYEAGYVHVSGKTVKITRHFRESGRISHYTTSRDYGKAFQSLAATVAHLERTVEPWNTRNSSMS